MISIHVPSKTGHPVATRDLDCRGIYMTVKWTEPEDNGGADITGYVITYGGRSFWDRNEVTHVDKYDELRVNGNTTNFQFTHQLKEWTLYRFTVAAVNDAGRGEFSEFSDYVETKGGKCCCNYHVSLEQLNMLQCTYPKGRPGRVDLMGVI